MIFRFLILSIFVSLNSSYSWFRNSYQGNRKLHKQWNTSGCFGEDYCKTEHCSGTEREDLTVHAVHLIAHGIWHIHARSEGRNPGIDHFYLLFYLWASPVLMLRFHAKAPISLLQSLDCSYLDYRYLIKQQTTGELYHLNRKILI